MPRTYTEQQVEDGLLVFKELLIHGDLGERHPLLSKWREAREFIEEGCAKTWGVAVGTQGERSVHLYALPGNTELGYTAEMLRDRLGLRDQSPTMLNLCLFIMLCLTCLFQGDGEAGVGERLYLTQDKIIEFIDERLRKLAAAEDVQETETRYALEIRGVAEKWFEMQTIDDRELTRTQKNRMGLLNKVLRFWEDEKLVYVDDSNNVRPLPRLQASFEVYYADRARRDALRELLRA